MVIVAIINGNYVSSSRTFWGGLQNVSQNSQFRFNQVGSTEPQDAIPLLVKGGFKGINFPILLG